MFGVVWEVWLSPVWFFWKTVTGRGRSERSRFALETRLDFLALPMFLKKSLWGKRTFPKVCRSFALPKRHFLETWVPRIRTQKPLLTRLQVRRGGLCHPQKGFAICFSQVSHGLLMRIFCMVYFHWTVEEFEQAAWLAAAFAWERTIFCCFCLR